MDRSSSPLSTLVHALLFPLQICWELMKAYKATTWDQAREAFGHIQADYVPAPAKWILGVGLAFELVVAFHLWLVLHAALPFLLASPVEDLLMVPPLCVLLWGFNLYSRHRQRQSHGDRLREVVDRVKLRAMSVPPIPEDLQVGGRTIAPHGSDELPPEVIAEQHRAQRRRTSDA